MSYPKKDQTKKYLSCKHIGGKTNKGYGCGSNIQLARKCQVYGQCIFEKVCKMPENIGICEGCIKWESK